MKSAAVLTEPINSRIVDPETAVCEAGHRGEATKRLDS
jgi:hypothetical protein